MFSFASESLSWHHPSSPSWKILKDYTQDEWTYSLPKKFVAKTGLLDHINVPESWHIFDIEYEYIHDIPCITRLLKIVLAIFLVIITLGVIFLFPKSSEFIYDLFTEEKHWYVIKPMSLIDNKKHSVDFSPEAFIETLQKSKQKE